MRPDFTGTRVLVTGGTGFVGRHLTRALLNAGADLTCLVRASSNCAALPGGARPVQADLLTGAGLDEAVAGQDVVIHMAALLFGLGWQEYLRGNALAAERLGTALRRRGDAVRRVVLVSSLAATGPSAVSPGVRDDTPAAPVSAYGWSKFVAEQTLGRHVGERMVTLRPPIIYGSGDRGLLPYFRSARLGVIATPGRGRRFPVSAVHVSDMVQAVLLACGPAARGVYHINDGTEHTMDGIGLAIAAALDRTARVLPVPLPLMGAAAAVSGLAGRIAVRLGRRAPSWNPDKYLEARQPGWLCDASRICGELGYAPAMELERGLSETVEGYRKDGWL